MKEHPPDHVWMTAGAYFGFAGRPAPADVALDEMVHFDVRANEVHTLDECTEACPR